jgi:hypothetical protein
MSEHEDARLFVATLARYMLDGHALEVHEPPIRGRKGPAREVARPVQLVIHNARAFDAIRWALMRSMLARRGPGSRG